MKHNMGKFSEILSVTFTLFHVQLFPANSFPNFAFEKYWVNLSERQRTIVAIIEVWKCLLETDWFCKRAKWQDWKKETHWTYSKVTRWWWWVGTLSSASVWYLNVWNPFCQKSTLSKLEEHIWFHQFLAYKYCPPNIRAISVIVWALSVPLMMDTDGLLLSMLPALRESPILVTSDLKTLEGDHVKAYENVFLGFILPSYAQIHR